MSDKCTQWTGKKFIIYCAELTFHLVSTGKQVKFKIVISIN